MAEKDFLQTLIKASGRVKRPTTTPKKVVYPADKSMDAKRNILYSWGVNKGGILGETLNGIGCLSQEVLNYLDKAQINALHKLGGSIWDIQREIYDARKAGIDTSALEAASKTAVDSLKALSATFEAYADAKKLDPKQVQQDVASVDALLIVAVFSAAQRLFCAQQYGSPVLSVDQPVCCADFGGQFFGIQMACPSPRARHAENRHAVHR